VEAVDRSDRNVGPVKAPSTELATRDTQMKIIFGAEHEGNRYSDR
jgi:hypothetical protein